MSVMRCTDPEAFNAIANDPRVHPHLGYAGHFDFTDFIADQRNWFLADRGGFSIFTWCAPGVYEGHLMFDPAVPDKIATSKRMADFMFSHGARLLWARPLMANKPARWHVRKVGFRHAGYGDLQGQPAEYLTMENAACHP